MEKKDSLEKRALITGIKGQDGPYLAELLLEKNYEVYGLYKKKDINSSGKIYDLIKKINLIEGDITSNRSIVKIIYQIQPHEIYNLAGQSSVPISQTQPISTAEINGVGVIKILEAIRSINPKIKFYQASTSEMFGKVNESPQTEKTPFFPKNPYGISKVFGHHITQNYRENYGIFACSGILFNHDGPKRDEKFITGKVSRSVAKIKLNHQDYFEVGNIDSNRDWGYVGDYVESMWLMLQQDKPQDYVIGTGKSHSVREFIEESFKTVGMPIKWEGKGLDEVGKYNNKKVVRINPKFYRPTEANYLLADSSKAKKEIGWTPKTSFKELVRIMVESEIKSLKNMD